jgi:threonine-phosphate decarboxylase
MSHTRTRVSSCYHGGIYSVQASSKVKIDFSSNVNPLGISKMALRSIKQNAARVSAIYPDPQCHDLKKSLIDYLGVDCIDTCWLNIGNGATELIHDFTRSFVRNKVVIPAPTFCEYELASVRMGVIPCFVPLDRMNLDASAIIDACKNSDALFLCNPNNPTGILSSRQVEKILKSIDVSTRVMLDECFIELVDRDSEPNSLINKIGEFDNLVILRSLTKSFGLAGLRLGYCVSNPEMAEQISSFRLPWNVNGIAQLAGIASLQDLDHLDRARKLIKKERMFMQNRLRNTGSFEPCNSDVNYFLINSKYNSTKLRDLLLETYGILVRDCSSFAGMDDDNNNNNDYNGYIRVAVKKHHENLHLLDALENEDDADTDMIAR